MTNGAGDDSGRGLVEGVPRTIASDAPPDSGVRAGDVLAGKYRVERILGSGGMGVVVAARHIQLDELVALKLLLPRTFQHPDAIARFMQEARAAVRIKDEHVARVSDVGQLENGAPYMVMEYLEGEDLGAWLVRHGPLPVEQAAEFIIQTCVAVADAHALGIVHRDLKPANLFCVRRSDGQLSIKVLDFGISKIVQGTSFMHRGATTETGMILGSPTYMSPEQMQGGVVDYQTDVWALGVVLYELLSGRPPFQATTMPGLAIKVVSEPPPSLRALRPQVPRGLEAAIERCLAKDQAGRFPSVASLSMALRPFAPARAGELVERASGILSGRGAPMVPAANAVLPYAETSPAMLAPAVPSTARVASSGRSSKGLAVAAGVLGIVVVSGALAVTLFGARGASVTPTLTSTTPAMTTPAITTPVSGTPVSSSPPSATPASASPATTTPTNATPTSMAPAGASMVSLAGGAFALGDSHESVRLAAFSLDTTEVTVSDYSACVAANACSDAHVRDWRLDGKSKLDDACNYGVSDRTRHPMNCVDWSQASSYCRFKKKRLPTEAEWEWAARGQAEGRVYPWGSDAPGSRICWSGNEARHGTCAVGTHPTGDAPGGIHDLAGNVAEWTATPFEGSRTARITRGGGWNYTDMNGVRAADRHSHEMADRVDRLGFRCAR